MNELKGKAHKLIDSVPDEKIAQVIVILEGIKSIMDNEIDEWDLKLIREAQEALKVGDFIPFEDVLKEAGLSQRLTNHLIHTNKSKNDSIWVLARGSREERISRNEPVSFRGKKQ